MSMREPPPLETLRPPPAPELTRARGKLDDAVITSVYESLAAGVSRADAAARVGVTRQALHQWLTKGRDLLADGKPASVHARLAVAVDQGEAHFRAWLIEQSNRASAGDHRVDARHIQWRLTVSCPRDFQVPSVAPSPSAGDGEAVQMMTGPEVVAALEGKLERFLATADAPGKVAPVPVADVPPVPAVPAPDVPSPEDTIQ